MNTNYLLKTIGYVSRLLIFLSKIVRHKKNNIILSGELDKTGRTVTKAQVVPKIYDSNGIVIPYYDNNLSFMLWRSQELSLFNNNKSLIKRPIMDFGCGDGSFASVVFDTIEYGVDVDEAAIAIAKEYGIYSNLLLFTDCQELPSCSVKTVISNSVLEHVEDIHGVLSEIYRILQPEGKLIFSVPVSQFLEDLSYYYGRSDANDINSMFYHRNLYTPDKWKFLLEDHGFRIDQIISYQGNQFTFFYRFLFVPVLGRFISRYIMRNWKNFESRIVSMLRKSINNTETGGNIFIVVHKGGLRSDNDWGCNQ